MKTALVLAGLVGCHGADRVDLDKLDALVPAKYQYKLAFEMGELTSGTSRHVTYSVPLPKHWKHEDGSAKPIDWKLGGDSVIALYSSCDQVEPCTDGDLTTSFDRHPELGGGLVYTVLRDERGDHRRTLITKGTLPSAHWIGVRVIWWNEGGHEYHTCEVRLEPQLAEAVDVFTQACNAATVVKGGDS